MTPQQAAEQRASALAKANGIRSERAQIRRRLKARAVRLDAVLDSPALETLAVVDLLGWLPYMQELRPRRLLREHDIRETLPVGKLTDRQRTVILSDPRIVKFQPDHPKETNKP